MLSKKLVKLKKICQIVVRPFNLELYLVVQDFLVLKSKLAVMGVLHCVSVPETSSLIALNGE